MIPRKLRNVFSDGRMKSTSKNKPSTTIKDFAEKHGLCAKSLIGAVRQSDDISPSFNAGRRDYYHITDIEAWFKSTDSYIKRLSQ